MSQVPLQLFGPHHAAQESKIPSSHGSYPARQEEVTLATETEEDNKSNTRVSYVVYSVGEVLFMFNGNCFIK